MKTIVVISQGVNIDRGLRSWLVLNHAFFLTKDPVNFFSLPEVKKGSPSKVLFFVSIDYYLSHKETFASFSRKKKPSCDFYIVLGKEAQKKLSKIDLKIPYTLLPDKALHHWFKDNLPKFSAKGKKTLSPVTEKNEKKILEIATILGSEHNIEILLNKVLNTCMEITNADAGSLGILGFDKQLRETDNDILTFYVSRNNSKEIHFNRFSMKIGLNSLVGYSILKKEILNIPDAYKIPATKQYHFNNSFDQQTGFKTKSVLVVPMIDSQNNIIGVIQLLNKKNGGFNRIINYDRFSAADIGEFNILDQETVRGITNLGSVLLKNQLLYNQVNDLLENFVKASVYAVEQRDPATSGHSERVATYTVALAEAASASKGVLENYRFDRQQIRELRYAALLHDFGKIGVREKILVKANKLEDYELETIMKRIRIYLLNFQLKKEKEKYELISNQTLSQQEISKRIANIDHEIQAEFQRMDVYQKVIRKSNIPQVIEEEASRILAEIHSIKFFDNQQEQRILDEDEFKFLNIKRGSLTQEERIQIESHVSQSFFFLQRINWISGFKNVPDIAYGHHEKLDGSGYPRNLTSDQIMPQTKIMTICDIYDALTASDRPYKKALSPDLSIKILLDEVKQKKIDGDLVDLFIKKEIYTVKPEVDA